MARDGRPDLAAILRGHGAAFLASHPRPNRTRMNAWRAIVARRTAALGDHVTQCDVCGMRRHPHLHALMAGGALTDGGAWVGLKRGFLFPVKALSHVLRGKFVAALKQEHAQRRLAPAPDRSGLDGAAWQALLSALYRHDWVVYAKSPDAPAQVLDYLARYTHKVAISNHRITSVTDGVLSFRVRDA